MRPNKGVTMSKEPTMAEDNVVVDRNLSILIADLRPYAARQLGSLRIDMNDVRSILALYDAAQAHEPSTDVVEAADVAERVVLDVSELPDRTSPADWPDAMLVTADELHAIVAEHATAAIAAMRPESERVGIVAWHGPGSWPPELKRIVGEIRVFIAESERGDAHFLPPHHYAPLRPLVDQLSALGQEIVGAQP